MQEISGPQVQHIAAYTRANGRIISRQAYNANGNDDPDGRRLYYAYDGLDSVASLTNHQGKAKTRYRYDAFGEVVAGDLKDNPYAFTGKRFDTESGLYHFHFRNYDPETGVWTTPDPISIWGGMNLYRYVRNNPVRFVDPFGLTEENNMARLYRAISQDDLDDIDGIDVSYGAVSSVGHAVHAIEITARLALGLLVFAITIHDSDNSQTDDDGFDDNDAANAVDDPQGSTDVDADENDPSNDHDGISDPSNPNDPDNPDPGESTDPGGEGDGGDDGEGPVGGDGNGNGPPGR